MRFIVKLTSWLLRNSRLSIEDRNILIAEIIDKLAILPFNDIISVDKNGSLLIKGKPLDYESVMLLRESARGMKTSMARKLIREQVAYQAIVHGVHKAEMPTQMFFSKAAIWWGQREDEYINLLAGEDEELNP